MTAGLIYTKEWNKNEPITRAGLKAVFDEIGAIIVEDETDENILWVYNDVSKNAGFRMTITPVTNCAGTLKCELMNGTVVPDSSGVMTYATNVTAPRLTMSYAKVSDTNFMLGYKTLKITETADPKKLEWTLMTATKFDGSETLPVASTTASLFRYVIGNTYDGYTISTKSDANFVQLSKMVFIGGYIADFGYISTYGSIQQFGNYVIDNKKYVATNGNSYIPSIMMQYE